MAVRICPQFCFCGEAISKNAFRRFESVYRPEMPEMHLQNFKKLQSRKKRRNLSKSPFFSQIRSALPSDVIRSCRLRHTPLTCLNIRHWNMPYIRKYTSVNIPFGYSRTRWYICFEMVFSLPFPMQFLHNNRGVIIASAVVTPFPSLLYLTVKSLRWHSCLAVKIIRISPCHPLPFCRGLVLLQSRNSVRGLHRSWEKQSDRRRIFSGRSH